MGAGAMSHPSLAGQALMCLSLLVVLLLPIVCACWEQILDLFR